MTYVNSNSRMDDDDDISVDDNNDDDNDNDDEDENEDLQTLWEDRLDVYICWKRTDKLRIKVEKSRKSITDEIYTLKEEKYLLSEEEFKMLPQFVELKAKEDVWWRNQKEWELNVINESIRYLKAVRCYEICRNNFLNLKNSDENLLIENNEEKGDFDSDLGINDINPGLQVDTKTITVLTRKLDSNTNILKLDISSTMDKQRLTEYLDLRLLLRIWYNLNGNPIKDEVDNLGNSKRKITATKRVYDRGKLKIEISLQMD